LAEERRYRILFLGPPGSGKGTYAGSLSKRYRIPHVSTGQILREAVESGSDCGNKVAPFLERGELVPDEIMIEIFQRCLSMSDMENGFILDGFPRTLDQAKLLEALFEKMNIGFDFIFNLWMPYDEIIERALGRANCESCGKIYNMIDRPPKVDSVCDDCGGRIVRRVDDTEEMLRHRLAVYDENTAPIIEYYSNKRDGCFHNIYSGGPPEEGLDEMVDIIETSGVSIDSL